MMKPRQTYSNVSVVALNEEYPGPRSPGSSWDATSPSIRKRENESTFRIGHAGCLLGAATGRGAKIRFLHKSRNGAAAAGAGRVKILTANEPQFAIYL